MAAAPTAPTALPVEWSVRLGEAVDRTGKKRSYIAEQAGIRPETLSRILRGRQRPFFDTIVRIARAAGETVAWILGEKGYGLSVEERALLLRAARTMESIASDGGGSL